MGTKINTSIDVIVILYLVYFFISNTNNNDLLFHYVTLEMGFNFSVAILISLLGIWRLSKGKNTFMIFSILCLGIIGLFFYWPFVQSQTNYLTLTNVIAFLAITLSKISMYSQYKHEAPVWALFNLFAGLAILLPSSLFISKIFLAWGILYFGVFNIYMIYAKQYVKWPHTKIS